MSSFLSFIAVCLGTRGGHPIYNKQATDAKIQSILKKVEGKSLDTQIPRMRLRLPKSAASERPVAVKESASSGSILPSFKRRSPKTHYNPNLSELSFQVSTEDDHFPILV